MSQLCVQTTAAQPSVEHKVRMTIAGMVGVLGGEADISTVCVYMLVSEVCSSVSGVRVPLTLCWQPTDDIGGGQRSTVPRPQRSASAGRRETHSLRAVESTLSESAP